MAWVQEMFGWMDGMAWRVEMDTLCHNSELDDNNNIPWAYIR